MEQFYIGQTFDKPAPPEAAAWCNEHNAKIVKEGKIRRIVEKPAPPETKTVRTFSKFSIWAATQQMQITLDDGTKTTVWAEFEKFMTKTILPSGTSLISGWFQLNDLVEDNPFFEQFYPLACEQLGKELVDQVLAASVTATKEVEA